jgi:hypothetical protein
MVLTSLRTFLLVCLQLWGQTSEKADASQGVVDWNANAAVSSSSSSSRP